MAAETANSELLSNLADLNEKIVLALIRRRIDSGDDPLHIIEECRLGMEEVGRRYENKIYYISGLIMAGDIFRQVMELVGPRMQEILTRQNSGRVLLGTVRSDIHDIGKNIAGMLLTCHGFTVDDLGVDVPPAVFVRQCAALQPDIIGLSCLLTSAYDSLRETVAELRQSARGGVDSVPILIGGAQLNDEVCRFVGADYWVDDAMQGLRLCQSLLSSP